jgi:bleomycin hydrolase
VHDYKLVFGVDMTLGLSKAERLLYGESMMTHAMAFTAVTLDEAGNPTKFQVENSWGDEFGEKGYLVISRDWFLEFVFEVVVDKKFVSQEIMEVFTMKPIVLPAWDPMGKLAQ